MDAVTTPKVHPQVIYLEVRAFVCLEDADRSRLLWAAVCQCPQSVDPHGEGVRDTVQKLLLDGRVQLSAAYPQQGRGAEQPETRNPALPQAAAVPSGDTEGKPPHRLCRPGLHQQKI